MTTAMNDLHFYGNTTTACDSTFGTTHYTFPFMDVPATYVGIAGSSGCFESMSESEKEELADEVLDIAGLSISGYDVTELLLDLYNRLTEVRKGD
jgi:hypothetical protein